MPPGWGLCGENALTTMLFDDPEEATWVVERSDYLDGQADSASDGCFTAYGTSNNPPGPARAVAAAALPRKVDYLVLVVRTVDEDPVEDEMPVDSYMVDCLVLVEDANYSTGTVYRRAGLLRSVAEEDISAVSWTERALKIVWGHEYQEQIPNMGSLGWSPVTAAKNTFVWKRHLNKPK